MAKRKCLWCCEPSEQRFCDETCRRLYTQHAEQKRAARHQAAQSWAGKAVVRSHANRVLYGEDFS